MIPTQIIITNYPLNVSAINSKVKRPSNGGIVTFQGTTRDNTDGHAVTHLEYEAYEEMATKVIASIVSEAESQWGIDDVVVAHRLGQVEVGEISMVVAVGYPHRKQAFTACSYIVDRIKEIAPIWKKEFFNDGSVWVGSGTQYASQTVVKETPNR